MRRIYLTVFAFVALVLFVANLKAQAQSEKLQKAISESNRAFASLDDIQAYIDESDPKLERPGMFFCPVTDTSLIDFGRSDGTGWGHMTRPHPAGWWGREHLSYGYNRHLGFSDNSQNNDAVKWIKR